MPDAEHAEFDANKCCDVVSAMWLRLGEQIRDAIPDIIIGDSDPGRAVRWATCAEACFWQATGEATSHDVKDVITKPGIASQESGA